MIIKKILSTGVIYGQNQEIVYRDKFDCKYEDMYERVHRLANGLASLGVKKGDNALHHTTQRLCYWGRRFMYQINLIVSVLFITN